MEFNYDLEAADKEEMKLAEMNTSIASLLSGRGRVSASSSIRKQRRPVANMMPIKEEASEAPSKRESMQVPASFEFGEMQFDEELKKGQEIGIEEEAKISLT